MPQLLLHLSSIQRCKNGHLRPPHDDVANGIDQGIPLEASVPLPLPSQSMIHHCYIVATCLTFND